MIRPSHYRNGYKANLPEMDYMVNRRAPEAYPAGRPGTADHR